MPRFSIARLGQHFQQSKQWSRAYHRLSLHRSRTSFWGASAAGAVATGCGVVAFVRCDTGRQTQTPLPPRPCHHVLRPNSDPRTDGSLIIRFDPPEHLRTGAAFIVMPGGNYEHLSMSKEGHQVAVWLNSLGITAFVLRYRLLPEGHYWPCQLDDFELAMQTIRSNASAWRIDRDRIGVLGFSAGGHLAGFAAVSQEASLRPNLQILVYPTIDVTKPDWWPWTTKEGFPPPEASVHLHVHPKVPPAFLTVSTEDGLCTAEDNTEPYAEKLKASGVPVDHFVKPMGKHGHGLKGGWTEPCALWLARHGWAYTA